LNTGPTNGAGRRDDRRPAPLDRDL